MFFGKYRFDCTLQDEAELPVYKGSTFRGAFGNALKKVMCVAHGQHCTSCLLAGSCLYVRTFEPGPCSASSSDRQSIPSPPSARQPVPLPPYVIEPDPDPTMRFAAGAGFGFNLLLFGEANKHFPYFVYAVDRMGQKGIGRYRNGRRSRFTIDRIICDGRLLYDGQRQELVSGPYGSTLEMDFGSRQKRGDLTVELLTPLRLKYRNQLQAELPFHLLVRALLRRISSLFIQHGGGEPALDYRGLVARAQQVVTGEEDLRWCDWKRYSSRQEQTMLMGGLLGSITYRQVPDDYLPLFKLGRLLHVGKQTTFGLGAIAYRWEG